MKYFREFLAPESQAPSFCNHKNAQYFQGRSLVQGDSVICGYLLGHIAIWNTTVHFDSMKSSTLPVGEVSFISQQHLPSHIAFTLTTIGTADRLKGRS